MQDVIYSSSNGAHIHPFYIMKFGKIDIQSLLRFVPPNIPDLFLVYQVRPCWTLGWMVARSVIVSYMGGGRGVLPSTFYWSTFLLKLERLYSVICIVIAKWLWVVK